jgi:hypothetical protein
MSMEYIRKFYSVTYKRGDRVKTMNGDIGRVTGACHYARVRLDGEKRVRRFHPTDVEAV